MDGQGSRQQALRLPLATCSGAGLSLELVVQSTGDGSQSFPIVLSRHQSLSVEERRSLGVDSRGNCVEQFIGTSNSLERQSACTPRQQHPQSSQPSPVLHSYAPNNGASSRCCDTLSGCDLSSSDSTRAHSWAISPGASTGFSNSNSNSNTAGVKVRVHACNEQGMLNAVGEGPTELSSPHSVSAEGMVGRTPPAAPIDAAIFQMEDELSGSVELACNYHQ
jgi:hypothetical protein